MIVVRNCTGTVLKCRCSAGAKAIGSNVVLMDRRYETGKRMPALRGRSFWKRLPAGVMGPRTAAWSEIMLDQPVEAILSFTVLSFIIYRIVRRRSQ